MEDIPQKIIKVLPYRGINGEIVDGRKTKISLFHNRLEYSLKYNERVQISTPSNPEEFVDAMNNCEESGVIEKDSITGIVKYIQTEYHPIELTPNIVHIVDLYTKSHVTTFAVDSQESKDNLYNDIYEWKYKT